MISLCFAGHVRTPLFLAASNLRLRAIDYVSWQGERGILAKLWLAGNAKPVRLDAAIRAGTLDRRALAASMTRAKATTRRSRCPEMGG